MVNGKAKVDSHNNLHIQPENNSQIIRILILEKHHSLVNILQNNLEIQLDLEIVGCANSRDTLLKQVENLRPDLVLIDLEILGREELPVITNITQQFSHTKVIILSDNEKIKNINQAIKLGAKGYLLKSTPVPELIEGIRFVNKGYLHLSPGLFEKLALGEISTNQSESELPVNSNYQESTPETSINNSSDWSFVTKEMLDSLPQAWTRGILYLIFVIVVIALPWGMLSEVEETGTARGRLEPKEKVIKLDTAEGGTVARIFVEEGDIVQAGQPLLELDSELVNSELQQLKTQQESQKNRLTQLELLKNQILITLRTQEQQNQNQELEKQTQIEQARRELDFRKDAYALQEQEKQTQIEQAKQNLVNAQNTYDLAVIRLETAQKEVERYSQALANGISTEIQLVEQEELVRERERIKQQSLGDIQQAKLRLKEQQNNYQVIISQTQADIKQAQLRLEESQRSYDALVHSGKLSTLRIEEQQKDLESQITSLTSEISQTDSRIKSTEFQLNQRVIKASESGIIFDLTIEKPGAVVQPGETVAELAPKDSQLIAIAQIPTAESGSLQEGMDVKLKFDAYPFQDYGIVEGKLMRKSPTSKITDTAEGEIATFDLEIELATTCLPVENKCEPLKAGDTVTAEVILRKRKVIDFLLDPFKKLQKGGLEL